MLICYPLVSRVSFQAFDCIAYDYGTWLLRAEPSVVCGSSTHTSYIIMSMIVVVLFCFGMPLLFTYASYRALSGSPRLSACVSLLTSSYQPRFFYFEAVDLVRKASGAHHPLASLPLLLLSPPSPLNLHHSIASSSRSHLPTSPLPTSPPPIAAALLGRAHHRAAHADPALPRRRHLRPSRCRLRWLPALPSNHEAAQTGD